MAAIPGGECYDVAITEENALMRATFAPVLLMTILGFAPLADARIISFEATDNATVQPAGPRSGSSGKAFFNMEGSNNAAFASYGVIDFDFASLAPPFGGPVTGITSATLQMTQSNAAFSMPGPLSVYLTTQTAVDIQPGTSPLTYQGTNNGAASVGPQLSPLTLLGTGMYNVIANGTVDSYSLSFTGAALTSLLNAMNNDTRLRLVVTPDTAATAATYAGFTNNTLSGPTLVINATVVPEAASITLLALGAASSLHFRASRHDR
jgi:hypothetical protein